MTCITAVASHKIIVQTSRVPIQYVHEILQSLHEILQSLKRKKTTPDLEFQNQMLMEIHSHKLCHAAPMSVIAKPRPQ